MRKPIQTVSEFFESIISGLPLVTNLVITLDPQRFLKLDKELVDANEKKWQIIHYYGNDLTFRKQFHELTKTKSTPIILWITYPSKRREEKIDLSYIYDIVEKVEKIIDLSLPDILSKIIPSEVWPVQIFDHSEEIGNDLSNFRSVYQELRKELPPKAPLNANHVKALLIAFRNPKLPMDYLLFGNITAQEALEKYLAVVLSTELNKEDITLLKEIIENSLPLSYSEIAPWLEIDTRDLATFLYLLDGAQRYQIANPIIQLKGMALLPFDPEPLGNQTIDKVLENIRSRPDLKLRLITVSEKNLSTKEAAKIIDNSNLKTIAELSQAIQDERSPLLAYTLCNNFLKETLKNNELNLNDFDWAQGLNSHPILVEKLDTAFSGKAIEILKLLIGIASILEVLNRSFEAKTDLASLIDWYEASGFFKIEYEIAKVNKYLKAVYDDQLRKNLSEHLSRITKQILKKLETADLNLSSLIERNWKSYLSHPRLAINIADEHVFQKRITFTKEKKLWLLIFDGMRLDTWHEIVKPILSSKFEVKDEKLYLTMLPSETDIARVAILAGASPADWTDYDGGYTSDHNILASKLFRLSRYEAKAKLRVTVSSETDFAQRRLDEGAFLYNILIYNLSDDWIHSFRGGIYELNESIKGTLERQILPDLEQRIGDNDYIILTSDHGFIELLPEDGIRVESHEWPKYTTDTAKKQIIAYRHLKNIRHSAGYQLSYNNYEYFTVARGRKWFQREKGKYSRYAHGGISLDEMVVPAAVMEKITAPTVAITLKLPEIVQLIEDESSQIEIEAENAGNKETEFELTIRTNTGLEQKYLSHLFAKETKRLDFNFVKPDLRLKHLELVLTYKTPDGKVTRPQRKIVPISVKERKDKVEFSFGGLDKIGV